MDIIKHYSASIPYLAPKTSQSDAGETRYASGEAYRRMMEELEAGNREEAADPAGRLYNGSPTRANLSDTEIAVLANRYGVQDRSGEAFGAFLNDLESMGAISGLEKRRLSGHGDGEAMEEQEELQRVLAKIIRRVDARQASDAEASEKAALVRELADGNSAFYTSMRTTLKAQVEKTKEDEEQQAIIDALGAVLDAMSGKEDVSGDKKSVNKSAADLTKKIGDRVARLKREKPNDPEAAREIAKLEQMLKRLQEIGFYVDFSDTDDWWQDDEDSFETLTQMLVRRQAEELGLEAVKSESET